LHHSSSLHTLSCRSRNLLHHQPHACYHSTTYSPLFQLKQRGPRVVSDCAAHAYMHISCSTLPFILLRPAIKHYPSQPLRVTRYNLYIEDPFISFCLMQARRPALPVIDNARGAKLLLDCSLNDVSLLLFGRPGAYQVDLYCVSPWAVKAVLNTPRRRRCADPTCMLCTCCVGY